MRPLEAGSQEHPLDTERIMRVFAIHGVNYVLIGGIAALVHGASRVTVDADIVPEATPENLGRLLDALTELGAAVYVSEERLAMEAGPPWEIEVLRKGAPGLLEAEAWHFTTPAGRIDIVLDAAGVGDYEAHRTRADEYDVFGVRVTVAGLDDLIASKAALGREKDAPVLAELREFRDANAK